MDFIQGYRDLGLDLESDASSDFSDDSQRDSSDDDSPDESGLSDLSDFDTQGMSSFLWFITC
jgi:hypothetical protein